MNPIESMKHQRSLTEDFADKLCLVIRYAFPAVPPRVVDQFKESLVAMSVYPLEQHMQMFQEEVAAMPPLVFLTKQRDELTDQLRHIEQAVADAQNGPAKDYMGPFVQMFISSLKIRLDEIEAAITTHTSQLQEAE